MSRCSLLIAHEMVKTPTSKESVAAKSRAIYLPNASKPSAWPLVQFSADSAGSERPNQKQPEEHHVTSIIATAIVDIAGNISPASLIVRSVVNNQLQSAQDKDSRLILPVCLWFPSSLDVEVGLHAQ